MSNDTALIEFHGIRIPSQRNADDIMVPLRSMTDAMGIDAESARKLIERAAWAEGMTAVMEVMLPGQPRPYPNYMLSHRIVPMWIANISTSRIKDPEVRDRVIMWQREFTEVLARFVYGVPADPPDGEPIAWTWDEAAAILRQRYGLRFTAVGLTRALRSAGLLKVNGTPRSRFTDLFWFSGTHWEVHPHAVAFIARKLAEAQRDAAQFRFIQTRLEVEGVGQVAA